MLSRDCHMKRRGFARPVYERKPVQVFPMHRVPAPSSPVFVQTPKTVYVDDKDYRRFVASLPCFRCGIEGYSNACHSDSGRDGKGGSIKACDLTCWPGCVTRGPGEPGCHYLIGMTTLMNRGEKRAFEMRAAAATQATLIEQSAGDPKLRKVLVRVGLVGGDA
jgi:hypothetical protein